MAQAKKTAALVSHCVKEFLEENKLALDAVSVSLICEKIFTDKKEYTVEVSERARFTGPPAPPAPDETDIAYAYALLEKILSLMSFRSFKITKTSENGAVIFRICTPEKDGLLIGKNGQNIAALQYIMTSVLDKKLKKHFPLILDVDRYREKRNSALKTTAHAYAGRATESQSEVITEFLPSYERRIIHEELTAYKALKTFSLGKGPYKKMVITTLL